MQTLKFELEIAETQLIIAQLAKGSIEICGGLHGKIIQLANAQLAANQKSAPPVPKGVFPPDVPVEHEVLRANKRSKTIPLLPA